MVDKITSNGYARLGAYNATNIHLWDSSKRVSFPNGVPSDDISLPLGDHSGVFVASLLEKLGAYILRPPESTQSLLIEAQNKWLHEQSNIGYNYVYLGSNYISSLSSQNLANQGYIVIASSQNHIAIVYPTNTTDESIQLNGAYVTGIGLQNTISTTCVNAFGSDFYNNDIDYFYITTGDIQMRTNIDITNATGGILSTIFDVTQLVLANNQVGFEFYSDSTHLTPIDATTVTGTISIEYKISKNSGFVTLAALTNITLGTPAVINFTGVVYQLKILNTAVSSPYIRIVYDRYTL